jgi:hypothetical protein
VNRRATAFDRPESTTVQPRPHAHAWRRLHDGTLIAEAAVIPGMGLWRVSVYRVNGRASETVYVGRAFSHLIEAHQAADDLVQKEFAHECQTGVCGKWLRWRQDAD